jgi:hypothetical protein
MAKAMAMGDSEQVAQELLAKSGRIQAFNLQALARLLQERDGMYNELKDDAKKLEDLIGEGRKWQDLLDQTSLSQEKIKRYNKKLNEAKAELAESVSKDWQNGKLARDWMKKIAVDSWSKKVQAEYLAKQLKKELERVETTEYDFIYGEEGDGLHEFRRNLRWPVMELDVLKDVFGLYADSSCGKKAASLVTLGKSSRYATLKFNTGLYKLSACSYLAAVGAVEKLGEMKDALEQREQLEDELPADVRKLSFDILEALRGSDSAPVIKLLQDLP